MSLEHIKRGYALWLERAPPTTSWREVMAAIKAHDSPADAWPEEGVGPDAEDRAD